MSVYTSESPETLTDTVQRARVVHEESFMSSLCNMPSVLLRVCGDRHRTVKCDRERQGRACGAEAALENMGTALCDLMLMTPRP